MAQLNLNVTNNLELPEEGMVGIGFDTAKKLTAKDDEGNTWEIGGGGGGFVNITYAELKALLTASELEVGQKYLISDFAQSYNIFDGGTMHIIEEQIGIAEPIIVTASKVNELYKVAISTVYPQDIIHYSLDILDIRDIGFGNGANYQLLLNLVHLN